MGIAKMIGKLVLRGLSLPLMCALQVIKWATVFVVSMSAWVFYILAMVLTMAGVLSFWFGQEPAGVMLKMAGGGLFFFLIPHIGAWLAGLAGSLQAAIRLALWR